MKRTAGALMLLTGLTGCLSFPPDGNSPDKHSSVGNLPYTAPTGPIQPVGMTAAGPPASPNPTNWGPAPGLPAAAAQHVARIGIPDPAPGSVANMCLPPNGTPPGPLPQSMLSSLVPPVVTPKSTAAKNDLSAATSPTEPNRNDSERRSVLLTSANGLANAVPPIPIVGAKTGPELAPHSVEPMVRLVNSKQITLNFEVKDVGPSGLSGVELWYTQNSRDWKKYDAPPQAHAYIIEVDEEGMYGFSLVARSGSGLAKQPPTPGEQPQVWVIVDLTKPSVSLDELSAATVPGGQTMTIRWKASDRNLARQPISLYYGEHKDGPWKPIATNLENTGLYTWQLPSSLPPQIVVRVDAVDLAGNIGSAELSKPITLDASVPRPIITDVTPR
jgi:hypothetical protein